MDSLKKLVSFVKLLFTCGLLCILVGLIISRQDEIISIINNHILNRSREVSLEEKNAYYRNYDFDLVKNTTDFSPENFQDILDIYYTILNSGQNSFTFYCSTEYTDCISDIQKLADNQELLSTINNYVHPFNGFTHIETEYDTFGRVTVTIMKSYTNEEILQINEKMDELYPQIVQNHLSLRDNIRAVHDYIINHARYDSSRSDFQDSTYHSDIAYGPLFEGYAICGGYTDLMELFLERMGIKSFKVSSDEHVWNALYLDGYLYHLDLTWDDPVATDGKDYLEDNYFLISTSQLLEQDTTQHSFLTDYYPELS